MKKLVEHNWDTDTAGQKNPHELIGVRFLHLKTSDLYIVTGYFFNASDGQWAIEYERDDPDHRKDFSFARNMGEFLDGRFLIDMSRKSKIEISKVTITFLDGEVKEYLITAGPAVGGHLAREAGATGILNLFNGESSYAVPLVGIRDWYIEPHAIHQSEKEPA